MGYGLILLIYPFFWPNPLVWLSLLFYLPIAHNMIRVEEEHLSMIYGSDYQTYCQQVPRYFGFRTKER